MSVYEKTLLDPASAFTSPEQVLTSAELSREQKIEILHRWEYDARQMEVAEEENMLSDSDQPDILDEILPDLAERRRETGGRTAAAIDGHSAPRAVVALGVGLPVGEGPARRECRARGCGRLARG